MEAVAAGQSASNVVPHQEGVEGGVRERGARTGGAVVPHLPTDVVREPPARAANGEVEDEIKV